MEAELTISETRLFALLCCERFHGFQVKVVIEMKIVQILTMDQEIQHVVALTAYLQTSLDPIECRRLEELRRFERSEQVSLLLRLRSTVLQRVEDVILQQLLVADANLNRVAWWTMLLVPSFDQRNVMSATAPTRSHVERARSPQERDSVGCVVGVERRVLQERLNLIRQDEFLVVIGQRIHRLDSMSMRDRVDERIEVECGQIGIFRLDVDNVWCVIPGKRLDRLIRDLLKR